MSDPIDPKSPLTPPPSRFHVAYEGAAPWDIDRPQPAFVAVADHMRGSLLDVGCGTGENALFFAARGLEVWGVDMVPAAIARARKKATVRKLEATFVEGDALHLERLGRRFDHVIDSGLFHVFPDEERARYVEQLGRVLEPGGVYHMLCFSELTPGTDGPRRVTQAEIRAAFSEGWRVMDIVPSRFETRRDGEQPYAWLATIARAA
jgi:ubiquinone/menaquinone biosynthesis C-methylase UbiE